MKPNHIFIQLRNLTALRMHNLRFIDSCIRILGTRGSRRYLQQVILENWQRENIKFKKLPSGAIKSFANQKLRSGNKANLILYRARDGLNMFRLQLKTNQQNQV
jgi:hypothetical protein